MKILALHGLGSSASMLKEQLAPFIRALSPEYQFTFLDGAIRCGRGPGMIWTTVFFLSPAHPCPFKEVRLTRLPGTPQEYRHGLWGLSTHMPRGSALLKCVERSSICKILSSESALSTACLVSASGLRWQLRIYSSSNEPDLPVRFASPYFFRQSSSHRPMIVSAKRFFAGC